MYDCYSWYNWVLENNIPCTKEAIPSVQDINYVFLEDHVDGATPFHSDYVADVKEMYEQIKKDRPDSNIKYKLNEFERTNAICNIRVWEYGICFPKNEILKLNIDRH